MKCLRGLGSVQGLFLLRVSGLGLRFRGFGCRSFNEKGRSRLVTGLIMRSRGVFVGAVSLFYLTFTDAFTDVTCHKPQDPKA